MISRLLFTRASRVMEDSARKLSSCHKSIKIRACDNELYEELGKSRPDLYGNLSLPNKCGIEFNVDYYDSIDLIRGNSGNSNREVQIKTPIVGLLHGAPGSYEDFNQLIEFLGRKGIRTIAPNFPKYSATYEHSFRHSPRERMDFLLKFFNEIQVNQLDMLIGHSSAIYTILELLNRENHDNGGLKFKLKIKSLGLFSTPTYNLPPNLAVTPFRLFTLKLFDNVLIRPMITALIQVFVKFQGIKNTVDKERIEDLLIAASAVGYSDCNRSEDYLKLIRKFKLPTFVLFGCKDKLIPQECFSQLLKDLGITSDKEVKLYNEVGELVKDVEYRNDLIDVSKFTSGGHYVFQKYPNQVSKDLYEFLKLRVLIKYESTKL